MFRREEKRKVMRKRRKNKKLYKDILVQIEVIWNYGLILKIDRVRKGTALKQCHF